MIYLFYSQLTPNTASGNRFLSFVRGFDKLGINNTVVLHKPSADHYKLPYSSSRVTVKYLWKDWPIFRRVTDKICSKLSLAPFLKSLKEGDSVFVFGSPEYVAKFLSVPGIKIYHERTEHPEVLPINDFNLQKSYLEACTKINGLFVISTSLREYFRSVGVPESNILIVNMTVDAERFANIVSHPAKHRIISYCGTASNNKDGVDELIKAFAIVASKHHDVMLQIIGKAPSTEDASGNLKLVEDLGIKDRVIFTGVIPASEMPQRLKDSTILALDRPDSLQAQNGFPTKLGEYLLSERPVVVTRVGDIPLFLQDGVNALLTEERNSKEFASKLCWLLEHPLEAEEIGKAGSRVAKREFNNVIESKKIVDFINR